MDVREKLVKLVEYMDGVCPSGVSCYNCQHKGIGEGCSIQAKVDYLMNGGVTVQEWIPVKDRLPENDCGKHWKERKYYLVYLQSGMMRVAHFGYDKNDWWIDSHHCVLHKDFHTEATHWMPLPQPPKGE